MSIRERGTHYRARQNFAGTRFPSPEDQDQPSKRSWKQPERIQYDESSSEPEIFDEEQSQSDPTMQSGPAYKNKYNKNPTFKPRKANFKNNPIFNKLKANYDTKNIPSLFSIKPKPIVPVSNPKPLIDPQTVQQLRAKLFYSGRTLDCDEEEYGYVDEYNSSGPSFTNQSNRYDPPARSGPNSFNSTIMNELLELEKYTREEQETKKKIDEIIMVAQALREKLDREEELRRMAEMIQPVDVFEEVDDYHENQSPPVAPPPRVIRPLNKPFYPMPEPRKIPQSANSTSKIPSLLDVCVSPPDIDELREENAVVADGKLLEDVCWNCLRYGHKHLNCKLPQFRMYCFRCGNPGFDIATCPSCRGRPTFG